MKQESIYHPQHKPSPWDPQTRAYSRSDGESGTLGMDVVADSGYHDSIRDWQNPSRFRRDDAC